jgi:uncharacterized Fe-S cluster-containing radical SAM superfamily protein
VVVVQSEYDPLELAKETEKIVVRGDLRKYYRLSWASRWYGGISEAHCCGCCLRCVFCWSGFPRDHPEAVGDFYSPEEVYGSLTNCAVKKGLNQLRITGNEPTLGWSHLLRVLELVSKTKFLFILETNGILIGNDRRLAKQLSKFKNLHVRVSLKGTNREEFAKLTGAKPEGFDLQMRALENLLDAGISFNPAVMLSFSDPHDYEKLKHELQKIHKSLPKRVEEEYAILYPPVITRLKEARIIPRRAFPPSETRNRMHY